MEKSRAWFDCYLLTPPCSRAAIDVRDRSGEVGRARQPATRPPPDATNDRRVPGRHDLRAQRKGRPDVRAAPQARSRSSARRRSGVDRERAAAGRGSSPCSPLARRRGRRSSSAPAACRRRRGAQNVDDQLWRARRRSSRRARDSRSRSRRRRPRSRARTSSTSISRWRRALGHASARPSSSCRACARWSRSDRAGRGCRVRGARARRKRRRRHHGRPRRHVVDRSARRHRPADRRGGRVRDGRARREGLLRLREREGRRQRPKDRVPLLGRRLQPGADRPAHTPARRAGQGVRGLQLGRHGEQPRDPRLPERAEGAPALRRRRLAVDRPQLRAVPVDDGLPA